MKMRLPRWLTALLVAIVLIAPTAGRACVGDCDGNRSVTVDEILTGVGIALGNLPADRCSGIDGNGDRQVTVDEIVGAVNNALNGCAVLAGAYDAAIPIEGSDSVIAELVASGAGVISGTFTLPDSAARSARAANSSVPLGGTFDPATGRFAVSGLWNAPGGQAIPVGLSGTLPGFGGNGTVTLQIGTRTYTGTIRGRVPMSPTPTATPTVSGTLHTIIVGRSDTPFFPEFLEIDRGDTVEWSWVGGPHSVVSAVTAPPGQSPCTPNGIFTSPVQSGGTFRYTFNTPGEFWYHCGVSGHCANFESALIVVRAGTPTPTRTATPTFPPTPTATPTPDTVGGVSRAMIGTYSGMMFYERFGTQQPVRLRIDVFGETPMVTDLSGFLFGNVPLTMMVASPTRLTYHRVDLGTTDFFLELSPAGVLNGRYEFVDPNMPTTPIRLELTKE